MIGTSDISRLAHRLSNPASLITNLNGNESYFHDATDISATPSAILMAENHRDVLTAVRFCIDNRIPITPRGAGTGLSGGCVPSENALALSTERMDSIEILPQEKIAICGPGVITKDLQDQAAMLGLTYPPDPASYEECTLGGNIAEGAGGLRCKRFGVTKDYILGLEAVTGEGDIIRTGVLNENRGFNIGDLFIGSEGTLAIITSIVVSLIDSPGRGATILAAFERPKDAARTVSAITSAGMIPTVLEYIDGDTVKLANEYHKTEGIDNAEAVLLIETSDKSIQNQIAMIDGICKDNRASYIRVEPNADDAESLWEVRRNISKAAKAAAKVKISEDVAVPNSRFAELVEFVSALNQELPVRVNSYGHAGDGNLHVNFLATEGSPEEMAIIEGGINRLMKKTIELRGTLSGEHGIGIVKKQFMDIEFDYSTLNAMKTFRELFNPHGILNPGKIFAQ